MQKVFDVFPVTPLLAIQLILLAIVIWLISTVSVTMINKGDTSLDESVVYESVDLQNKYVAVLDYYPLNVRYAVAAETVAEDNGEAYYDDGEAYEMPPEDYDPLAPVIAETDPVEPSATRG